MPLAGKRGLGKGLQIGYFAQHQLETLRHDDSPLQHLARLAPDTREQELRDFLGGFNFPGDMVTSKIAPFSGGEKAAGAGADRLAEAEPAAARRADQPPGPGNP
jgi:ATP-binding cassette subfamily F protein 3